jgi:hypothetical protein
MTNVLTREILAASDLAELSLSAFDDIEVAAAEYLVEHYKNDLSLALESLSPDLAAVLALHPYRVRMSKLRELSPEAAEQLARRRGPLSFFRIENLSAKAAEELGKMEADLRLFGYAERLTPAVAGGLSQNRHRLSLMMHHPLTPAAAKELSRKRGGQLSLHASYLWPESSGHLAKFKGNRLAVECDDFMPENVAPLAGCTGDLVVFFWGYTHGVSAMLQPLVRHRASLQLVHDHINQELAALLAMHQGPVELSGIKKIPAASARNLAKLPFALTIHGLRKLRRDFCQSIMSHAGQINLPDLEEIEPGGEAFLLEHIGPIAVDYAKLKRSSSLYSSPRVTQYAWPHT